MEIYNDYTFINLSTPELYKLGMKEEGLNVSSKGALLADSGEKKGRSPDDKRIVKDENTQDIWWRSEDNPHGNKPIRPELFEYYRDCGKEMLETAERIYVVDAYAGWDESSRVKIRVYCTCAYHALFMKNMLVPSDEKFQKPDFIIYNFGVIDLSIFTNILEDDDIKDPELNSTLVALNFTTNEMIIYGTQYAGEMKKGILTLMMYKMPLENKLPLHSSANINRSDPSEITIFFGLSGTGKTTLSADPGRYLIGDDEHVWTDAGIFNIEGGCYAKCIGLKESSEPDIFNAIKFGAVLENLTVSNQGKVDFQDTTKTKNTRCSYPLEHIPNCIIPAKVDYHPKNIVLLTCDAFGILPPVSKLTPEQAVYFFVNGYTSKVAGTEVDVNEPVAVFSACFGEPFIVWNPLIYGELLKKKIEKHGSDIWMLNTGWIEGPYGVGHRISLEDTRVILNEINNGKLAKRELRSFPVFNIKIPKTCDGIKTEILDPLNLWPNKDEYRSKLESLAQKFSRNYKAKLN